MGSTRVFSQALTTEEKQALTDAKSYYFDKQYDKALPLFLRIDSILFDYTIKYRIGACYLNSEYDKLKAIPFLEEVNKNETLEIPHIAYFELGNLYHYIYRFDDAIEQYQRYIDCLKIKKNYDKAEVNKALRMIEVCNNAKELTTKPLEAEVQVLGSSINTLQSDFCPMISADERIMLFMRDDKYNGVLDTGIFLSRKTEENYWGKAIRLEVKLKKQLRGKSIKLAGLSSDGNTVFLNIGNGISQDIYKGNLYGNSIIDIKPLNKFINTPYFEGRVSLSPDGNELFFVSDRPGGFGGTDIYKSKLNSRKQWSEPVNLGEQINTPYDEDSPFLHPSNKILFFSSSGHNTIGGKDVFKSSSINGFWTVPQNMGMLNSTKDDLYFVLNANGQVGYFSSSKNNIYDKHNIFKVNFKDLIPLTLLKGTIKAGNPLKPIDVDIKVFDKETGKQIEYVYTPKSKTGEYLMIFPPAKNYDIVVSSEKYMTQVINVYIPYQTYFYELFQEIILHPITINKKVVGEKVTVNNVFYDLYRTDQADSLFQQDLRKNPQYYDHLLNLVDQIIETSDTVKIDYVKDKDVKRKRKKRADKLLTLIEDAIETCDPVTLNILDANIKRSEKIKTSYFYKEGNKDIPLDTLVVGGDTIFSAPKITDNNYNNPMFKFGVKDSESVESVEGNEGEIKYDQSEKRNYIHQFAIYYDVNSSEIKPEYITELEEICKILLNNENVGVEIYGYADLQGEKDYNMTLSQKRATVVLDYLLEKRINIKKIITKGFGSIGDLTSKDENRRVNINVFEISDK